MSLESDEEMPLSAHIEELAKRLLVVILATTAVMVVAFVYSDWLLDVIWYQFFDFPPRVYQPFAEILTRLRLSAMLGLALAVPLLVYEAFEFMKPGLYPSEQRYFLSVVPVSVVLMSLGMAFSFTFALPVLFRYFIFYSEDVATAGLGLVETFNLIVLVSLAFGVVFQVPLLMVFAVKMEVASRRWFDEHRIYVWGGCITVAALFAGTLDPTGVAGLMVALTMILLFEGTVAGLRIVGVD
ncbi:MAG: twin-arginine translocase subunit TatC [Halobacteriota archaeon]